MPAKSKKPQIIDGLSVCVDCAMLIANDDTSGMDDATEAACRDGIQREAEAGGHWCLSGGEEEESSFSWAPCDCCRSSLGGDRVKSAVIYPR
jgi:hypothetical protein